MEEKLKTSYYFPHDIGACNDPKLIDIRISFGWKGIGMFWAIIEALHKEKEGKLPSKIISSMIWDFYSQEEIRESRHIREESKEFEKALYANALLVVCDGIATNKRVQENITERKEKSDKARASAGARWSKEKPKNANAMPSQCERNALKERKGKDSKVNNISTNVDSASHETFGNEEINKLLEYVKKHLSLTGFVETSKMTRFCGYNLLKLANQIGKSEFVRRFEELASQDFHRKNMGSLQYVYKRVKGFVSSTSANDGIIQPLTPEEYANLQK